MKRMLTTYNAISVGVLVLVLFLGMYAVFGQNVPRQLANILLLGTAVTISVSWFFPAMRAFKRGAGDDISKIVLTVWLSWTALVVQRVYTIIVENVPAWTDTLRESPASIIVAVLILISGGYAVVAPATGEDIPRREKVWTLIAATIGGIVMGGMVVSFYFMKVNN